jgi:hypothetical protein
VALALARDLQWKRCDRIGIKLFLFERQLHA